jgi:hypothetical protein
MRSIGITFAVLAAGAVPALAAGSPRSTPAHVARTLTADDNCAGHYVRSSGSTLVEEGRCSGPLGGSLRARVVVAASFTGNFTFDTAHGEIRGRGSAQPRGSGRYESFAGTLLVTGGTGRYARAHGHAKLYGVFDRKTYAVTAQTRGTLSY